MRFYGYAVVGAVLRLFGFTVMRLYGCLVLRLCGCWGRLYGLRWIGGGDGC